MIPFYSGWSMECWQKVTTWLTPSSELAALRFRCLGILRDTSTKTLSLKCLLSLLENVSQANIRFKIKYFDPVVSENQTNHAITVFSWCWEFIFKVAVFRDSLFEIIPNTGLQLAGHLRQPEDRRNRGKCGLQETRGSRRLLKIVFNKRSKTERL